MIGELTMCQIGQEGESHQRGLVDFELDKNRTLSQRGEQRNQIDVHCA
jgi:hypothetical protein